MSLIKRIGELATKYIAFIVLGVSIISLALPSTFLWVVPYTTFLLGVAMFGMGMTLDLNDFKVVFSKPKEVFIGCLAQFTIMPILAFILAKAFKLPPELAVGVILVGTCPGGTASNVITYIAKGDVALSVAMTMVSTVLAPILTPILTLLLAEAWIPVSATSMFISIVKVVIVPVILGILAHKLLNNTVQKCTSILPVISVTAIVLIIGGIIGSNAEKIMTTGVMVLLVVIIHNGLGVLVGYLIAYILKVDSAKAKAIAIEVGMQNSGLAVSLATAHISPVAAIPGAIFSVWHNISGSIVANIFSSMEDKKEVVTEVVA